MTSLSRRLKRQRQNSVKKEFRKKMKEVKKSIKCIACDKAPSMGDKIDDWRISQQGDTISLLCTECWEEKQNED